MEKIKLGAVSYLNTKPLLYGIERLPVKEKLEIVEDHPANIAQMLLDGEIDLGLVPVAILPRMKESYIVSDYCIASNGPVGSVCIFSEVPIDQIQKLLLDYQSKTSVNLARILLKKYWVQDVVFEDAEENYEQKINGTTAGLVIGDRAFQQRTVSPFKYDLGEAWNDYTGLPFVFAAWVSNKPLSNDFIEQFNEANAFGLSHLPEIISNYALVDYDLDTYYTKNISYKLDDAMRAGMKRFLLEMELLNPEI